MKFSRLVFGLGAFASTLSSAAPTDTKPLVESNKLRRLLTRSALLAKAKTLEKFAYDTPKRNRQIGTPGHNSTINWIYDTLNQFPDYYESYLQPYDMLLHVDANLTINEKALEVYSLGMSPSGKAKGPVVHIPNLGCDKSDFPDDLTGKIALVLRGDCQSAVKDAYAGAANASGVIIYNTGNAVYSTMNGYSLQRVSTPEGPYVPTGGITRPDGDAIIALLDSGVEVIADLSTSTVPKTTYNVIAQTKGGDQENVVQIGAHTDSVARGPGINDNGSGTNSLLEGLRYYFLLGYQLPAPTTLLSSSEILLEVAKLKPRSSTVAIQLTNFSVNNAVRFSWWTAEEPGLLGAAYYVAHLNQSEINKIRALINIDMIASPNYAYQIYDGDGSAFNTSGPPGSAEIEHAFQDYFTNEAHQGWTETEFDGRSDYGPFLDVGIACGGLFTGAEGNKTAQEAALFGGEAGKPYDVNYHLAGDNATNLNIGAWIENTKAITHVIAEYARSFDGLPPRNVSVAAKRDVFEKREFRKRSSIRYQVLNSGNQL